jgi:nucleotide-binding universal stress UspA family protein
MRREFEMTSETIAALRPKQRPIRATAARPQASGVNSILFYVHDDDRLDARLQAALSIARTCSAHLQLLSVVPIEAYTVSDGFGGMFVSAEIGEALQEQAAKVRAQVERQLSKEDVRWDYQSVTGVTIAELAERAALSDLVIMGREPRERDFGRTAIGLAGQLLHRSSTPLFIPANGDVSPDLTGRAVIAWNGSFEAANAVRSSIGLLRMAADVRIVRYAEPERRVFPSTTLLEYLSRHDVHAELDEREPQGDVAANLSTYALAAGADYLLMGGYGHSRAGEFLFGGVTRELLRECPVSLVVAH